jgi:alkaline phosphatase D
MPTEAVEVRWEVASDASMRSIVRSGRTVATPQLGHSVHVEVDGLDADRWYWYRFHSGDATSPIGRTRTLPRADATPEKLRFAFTSCQNFEQGLFTAYEQMAQDDLDLVFHLGDYIYEYEAGRNGKVRTHQGAEIESLEDYRIRHAQYRADPLLHGMHAQCPWLVTWDDHEFDNNCANEISEELEVDPRPFLVRRANAYQAYYEMMPLRARSIPTGPDMLLYRKASFGRLAEFSVLDTRQYRTDQPNGDRRSPMNEAALDPRQTMLGHPQRHWLFRNLITSQAIWNVLAQQVMMGMVDRTANPDAPQYSMDQWPGYTAERMRLVEFMAERRVSNPVVLTGDIHTNWVNELRVDDRKAEQPLVGTEFVTTSLASGGNGVDRPQGLDRLLATNPCVKYHNAERGYVRCEVTPEDWHADYVVVDDVLQPGGKVFPRASFVVEAGNPRVQPA